VGNRRWFWNRQERRVNVFEIEREYAGEYNVFSLLAHRDSIETRGKEKEVTPFSRMGLNKPSTPRMFSQVFPALF